MLAGSLIRGEVRASLEGPSPSMGAVPLLLRMQPQAAPVCGCPSVSGEAAESRREIHVACRAVVWAGEDEESHSSPSLLDCCMHARCAVANWTIVGVAHA